MKRVIATLAMVFALCFTAEAAVTLPPVPMYKAQFFDNTGKVLSGGKIYFRVPGSTTLKTTYVDAGKLSANSNPVILDSAGRASIFIDGQYDIEVQDKNGVQITTASNIGYALSSTSSLSVIWQLLGTPTRTSNTTFTFNGCNSLLTTGSRIASDNGVDGMVYSTVTAISTSISCVNTVSVANDSGTLTENMKLLYLSAASPENSPIPGLQSAPTFSITTNTIWGTQPIFIPPYKPITIAAGAGLTFNGPVTISPNSAFVMGSGAVLVFAGPINAGRYQIFPSNATVKFLPGAADQVYPEWWGAIANCGIDHSSYVYTGTCTDNGTPLQSMINSVISDDTYWSWPTISFTNGYYYTTQTMKILKHVGTGAPVPQIRIKGTSRKSSIPYASNGTFLIKTTDGPIISINEGDYSYGNLVSSSGLSYVYSHGTGTNDVVKHGNFGNITYTALASGVTGTIAQVTEDPNGYLNSALIEGITFAGRNIVDNTSALVDGIVGRGVKYTTIRDCNFSFLNQAVRFGTSFGYDDAQYANEKNASGMDLDYNEQNIIDHCSFYRFGNAVSNTVTSDTMKIRDSYFIYGQFLTSRALVFGNANDSIKVENSLIDGWACIAGSCSGNQSMNRAIQTYNSSVYFFGNHFEGMGGRADGDTTSWKLIAGNPAGIVGELTFDSNYFHFTGKNSSTYDKPIIVGFFNNSGAKLRFVNNYIVGGNSASTALGNNLIIRMGSSGAAGQRNYYDIKNNEIVSSVTGTLHYNIVSALTTTTSTNIINLNASNNNAFTSSGENGMVPSVTCTGAITMDDGSSDDLGSFTGDAGTTCTMKFSQTYVNARKCFVSGDSATTVGPGVDNNHIVFTGSASTKYKYMCFGH